MKDIKFSIIIPVYNVERYIEQCIDSVLNQTYKNIEIILVNDGSTDNSGKICDTYSNNIDVKVIHQNNRGLSDARNTGIKNAHGEYIVFLDSDDYWNDIKFLENINNILSNKEFDLIGFGFSKFFEKNNKIVSRNYENYNDTDIDILIKENIFKACAWDKIVKKSIIDSMNMKFESGYYSEDIDWCSKLLVYCNNIYFYNKPVYIYRQRDNSITSNIKYKHIMDILTLCKNNIEFIKKYNDKKEIVWNYLAYEYCVALGLIGAYKGKEITELLENTNSLDELLQYDLNKKVKYTKILVKILGKKMAIFSLGIFIKLKRLKRS